MGSRLLYKLVELGSKRILGGSHKNLFSPLRSLYKLVELGSKLILGGSDKSLFSSLMSRTLARVNGRVTTRSRSVNAIN